MQGNHQNKDNYSLFSEKSTKNPVNPYRSYQFSSAKKDEQDYSTIANNVETSP